MWGCSLAAVRLFSGCGDIDMYDKTLVAHLLPPEMIIKNFIHGDPDCNYEKYLLELVNASTFFLQKQMASLITAPKVKRADNVIVFRHVIS